MKYLLMLLMSFSTQAEYVDIKINTDGQHSLSTLYHVKSKFIVSNEIKAGDENQTFLGLGKGYKNKNIYVIGGAELMLQDKKVTPGAYATIIYKQEKGRYAADFKIKYNEAFDKVYSNVGLHYAISDKVYISVGTNLSDMVYIGFRRWI